MGETLLSCPFCGCPPEAETYPGGARVGCTALECDMAPEADGATMAIAAAAWNTRAAPRETGPDLGAFARAIYQERAGWDGGDLQDLGVTTGVLVPEQRTEPCGEQCACADFCGPEEAPWTCYRLHPSLLAAPRPDAGEGGNA